MERDTSNNTITEGGDHDEINSRNHNNSHNNNHKIYLSRSQSKDEIDNKDDSERDSKLDSSIDEMTSDNGQAREDKDIHLDGQVEQNENQPQNNDENDLSDESAFISTEIPRRVKVYLLQGDDWLDNGTGYCTGEYSTELKKPYFIVRNELNSEDIILKTFLEGPIQYQRQQETLIVWSESSGKEIALSFQETDGCAEVCEFIIKAQQQDYSPEISLYYVIQNSDNEITGQNSGDLTELVTGPIAFPEEPNTTNLDVIFDTINHCTNSQFTRTGLLKFMIENKYFDKLIDIFYQSENEKKLQNLFVLSEIIKTLILYNEPALIEDILSSEARIFGLVGILEYDSECPNFKACHREFLKEKSKFKTVIDIPDYTDNETISDKLTESTNQNDSENNLNIFKKDCYFNFLKNFVLTRFLDDQTFNTLSSLIYYNQMDIINFLKDSERSDNFCDKLFNMYDDSDKNDINGNVDDHDKNDNNEKYNYENEKEYVISKSTDFSMENDISSNLSIDEQVHNGNTKPTKEISIETKRDGVKMLHQYVLITKPLQPHTKSDFFAVLVRSGLFKMISFALKDSDSNIRVLGTELIVIIIEQDVSLVSFIDKDTNEKSIDNLDPPALDLATAAASSSMNDIEKEEKTTEQRPLKLKLSDDMTLSLILSKLLLEDKNSGLKIQAFEALKILLDSNIASNTALSTFNGNFDMDNESRSSNNSQNEFQLDILKDGLNKFADGESPNENSDECIPEDINNINTTNYFEAFYQQVAPNLFKDFVLLKNSSINYQDENIQDEDAAFIIKKIKNDEILYQYLCELISFCTRQHETYISRPFFLENDILLGMAKLIISNVKLTLKLSAIRCLKSIILLNDDFYTRYIINNNILDYFFKFFKSIIKFNNLSNSTCLDFLEMIIKNCDENINHGERHNFKLLANYVYDNYKEICENEIDYVSTGKDLIILVESGFYDNNQNDNTKQFGISTDTTFDSEDEEFLNNGGHNVSTPIKSESEGEGEDQEVESFKDQENKVHEGSSPISEINTDIDASGIPSNEQNNSSPTNLFKDIERDMAGKNNVKRQREDDDEEYVGQSTNNPQEHDIKDGEQSNDKEKKNDTSEDQNITEEINTQSQPNDTGESPTVKKMALDKEKS